MHAVFHHASDLRPRDAGAQWYTVPDALGHRDQVGCDTPVLEAPKRRARAAEARLHLVGDTQPAVLANDIVDDLEILARRSDRPTNPLDRLGNEAGDLARRLIL